MKLSELLKTYISDKDAQYIDLDIEGVEKIQTVSTDANPLLDGIMEWHVGYFDFDEIVGRLFVAVERDERPL